MKNYFMKKHAVIITIIFFFILFLLFSLTIFIKIIYKTNINIIIFKLFNKIV